MTPTRLLLIGLAALAILVFLPSPAQAQQSASLSIVLTAPEKALTESDEFVTLTGTATLVADITAMTGINGIPVAYTVSDQPGWATVVISPATDVFPFPSAPQPGLSYTVTRSFTVVVAVAHGPEQDTVSLVEIAGETTPTPNGKSVWSKAGVPISFDAPEKPCPDHALDLDAEQLAALAVEAAEVYNQHQASSAQPEEVTVQSGRAAHVALPWVGLVAFAAVGAGIGLLIRRRLR